MSFLPRKWWFYGLIVFVAIFSLSFYFLGLFDSHFILKKTNYHHLEGWDKDDHVAALQAFQQSCSEILKRHPAAPFFSPLKKAGTTEKWQTICLAAKQIKKINNNIAKNFFEKWFDPFYVKNNFNPHGLFTGYYLPVLHASLKKDKKYIVPIYETPIPAIKADRAAINRGVLRHSAHVIAWGDSMIDIFFAQIQGSAIVELPNHHRFIIGYAGDNGFPYTAIGKILVKEYFLNPQDISMQKIQSWLLAHPDKIDDILNQNESYVFFKKLTNVYGIEHVPLTPYRSLAIDKRYIPLGAPLWLSTHIPSITNEKKSTAFQHLLIAQDTGGAIKGMVRGDIYFGGGKEAESIAGHMNCRGKYWIFLPKE